MFISGRRGQADWHGLKTWHILRKLRCCPWHAGQLATAIHVLQVRQAQPGWKRFTVFGARRRNPCHQAIFVEDAASAVTSLDPEMIQISNAVGQGPERRRS
jgi:hypothetical protein